MNKSFCIFLVFFCVTFLCAGAVQPVKADITVYIRPDGSVEKTEMIERNGDVYTFRGNIYVPIVIERNSIVLDGGGYTLEGSRIGVAVNLTTSNVTVKNIHIMDWHTGILGAYNNNTVLGNVITGCSYGIKIYADEYRIIGNYISNNGTGIHIANSFQIFVSMNNITNNSNFGINFAVNVGGGEVIKNNIVNNNVGIHNGGGQQKIYLNNFINNKAHYSGIKFWDAGYPPGGNYYSDYKEKYPNATIGFVLVTIWDTPYSFHATPEQPSQDNYPLVKPVSLPTIIPEFPAWSILPLFLAVMLVAVVLKNRLFHPNS